MRKKILYAIVLSIFLITTTCYTFAVTQSDVDNLKNKVDQMEERQDEIEKEKSQALSSIEDLNAKIQDSEEELDKLSSQIQELEASITKTEKELKQSEEKYEKQQLDLEDRLIAQYKAGKTTYLDVLLGSTSLSNFISRYFLVGQVAKMDQELLDSIEAEKQKIEKAKAELEQKKVDVKTAKANQEKTNVVLKNAKVQKNNQIAKLSDEEKALQQKIDEYQEEMNRMEEEIKKLAQSNSTGGTFNGRLAWPCPSYSRITSYFGGRYSPGGGVGSRNHKGIDLGAANGANILAAEAGTVITVSNTCKHDYPKTVATKCSCGGGFGNYVMISHAGGIVTVYAHCSTIKVSKGQKVSRGQVIAGVGTTGYSTGNHLHFGLLLNGTYVDPLPYIK